MDLILFFQMMSLNSTCFPDDNELELTLAIAKEELKNEGASISHCHSVQPNMFI